MKKTLSLSVAFLLVLSCGVGLAVAAPGQQGPPAQDDTGNVIHVSEGESIQNAIDNASDGTTIFVHEGTYEELLVIDGKDLKLIAVGDAKIKNPSPQQTIANMTDTIMISNSTSTIEGFTVDVNGGWGGIYAYGGPYYGTGEVEVTARNNEVMDYERNGITANGDLATGKFMDNTVTGEIDPYWANNGIQIAFGATGTIKGNTVKKNVWTGDGDWTASAILLYDVSGVEVTKNSVERGQLGIGVIGDNNKVVNNHLENGTWGISIYSGTNSKVISNTIVDYDNGVSDYGDETKVHANR